MCTDICVRVPSLRGAAALTHWVTLAGRLPEEEEARLRPQLCGPLLPDTDILHINQNLTKGNLGTSMTDLTKPSNPSKPRCVRVKSDRRH